MTLFYEMSYKQSLDATRLLHSLTLDGLLEIVEESVAMLSVNWQFCPAASRFLSCLQVHSVDDLQWHHVEVDSNRQRRVFRVLFEDVVCLLDDFLDPFFRDSDPAVQLDEFVPLSIHLVVIKLITFPNVAKAELNIMRVILTM